MSSSVNIDCSINLHYFVVLSRSLVGLTILVCLKTEPTPLPFKTARYLTKYVLNSDYNITDLCM
jgi:hypothetical protein